MCSSNAAGKESPPGIRNWAGSFVHSLIFFSVYERPNKGAEKESQKQHTLAGSAEAAPLPRCTNKKTKTQGVSGKHSKTREKNLILKSQENKTFENISIEELDEHLRKQILNRR